MISNSSGLQASITNQKRGLIKSKYRIHLSLYQSKDKQQSFTFPSGDIFGSLPSHRDSLDSEGIEKLRKATLARKKKAIVKEEHLNRKRGKSVGSREAAQDPPPLDPRFGPIQIDWADRVFDQSSSSNQEGEEMIDNSSAASNPPATPSSHHPQLSAPVAKFLKKSSFSIPERPDPRDSFKTGGTEVSFGIVHLFKDLDEVRRNEDIQKDGSRDEDGSLRLDQEEFPPLGRERSKSGSGGGNQPATSGSTSRSDEASTSADPIPPQEAQEEESIILESDDSGSILAVLAVPALMSASDFLAFVEPALDAISHVRMLREPQPNRCLILIKFRDSRDAEEFHKLYDGELFNAMNPDEVCQVVYVTEVTVSRNAKLPFSFSAGGGEIGWPVFSSLNFVESGRPNGNRNQETESSKAEMILKEKLIQELPTCAVCLERMDEAITGLMTVTCQHTFHCSCLSKWSDGRCPVCRYSQSRQISNSRLLQGQGGPSTSNPNDEEGVATCCTVCKTESDLWVCLICATVGCGRYKEGHAKQHYKETRHLYSLELETQRVWDYAGDGYVHRLIQNKADGKLVELPSSSSLGALAPNASTSNGGDGNGVSNTFHSEKIEAIGLEFSYLLTSQLESQRSFYEDKVKALQHELASFSTQSSSSRTTFEALEKANSDLLKEIGTLKEAREEDGRIKIRNEKKLATSLDLIRNLQKDLGNERSVTKGLMGNLERLKENEREMQGSVKALKGEIEELRDQVKDLMLFVSARDQIGDGEGAGGDVEIGLSKGGKKKGKKK